MSPGKNLTNVREIRSLFCSFPSDVASEMLFNEGEVRLSGSSDESSGRVEYYHAGSWGKICAKNWSDDEANTVCRYFPVILASL